MSGRLYIPRCQANCTSERICPARNGASGSTSSSSCSRTSRTSPSSWGSAAHTPLADVDYMPVMLGAIGIGIALAIVGRIAVEIAGDRDPRPPRRGCPRPRHRALRRVFRGDGPRRRHGRAVRPHARRSRGFWIANAMYLAFVPRPSSARRSSSSPIDEASRPWGSPRGSATRSGAAVRARRDDAGRARPADRRHPPDDHRDRAGPVLAIPGDGIPDRPGARRDTRRSSSTSPPKEPAHDRPENDRPRKRAPLPPRWVIQIAWAVHRGIYRVTGGRLGLRRQTPARWG